MIGNVSATDGDAGIAGVVTYSLSEQSLGDFSIDKDTGQIMVLNNSKLDREIREEMTLQVIATDGAVGEDARSTIVPVSMECQFFKCLYTSVLINMKMSHKSQWRKY